MSSRATARNMIVKDLLGHERKAGPHAHGARSRRSSGTARERRNQACIGTSRRAYAAYEPRWRRLHSGNIAARQEIERVSLSRPARGTTSFGFLAGTTVLIVTAASARFVA